MTKSEELLEVAIGGARAGAQVLMGHFGDPSLAIRSKGPGLDVVTEADTAAEEAIRRHVLSVRPADGFAGEEGSAVVGTSGVSWVVDPLDSTANFIRRIPVWSVSIAARDAHQAGLAAVVAHPPSGEVICASRTSSLTVDGSPVPGVIDRALSKSMVVVGWGRKTSGLRQAAAVQVLTDRAGRVRSPGSPALGLAWTAAGRFDAAYYEMDFNDWDVAAGAFLCAAAGLSVEEAGPAVPGGSRRLLAAPDNLFQELASLLGMDRPGLTPAP